MSRSNSNRNNSSKSGPCEVWCLPTVIYLGLSLLSLALSVLDGRYSNIPRVYFVQAFFIAFWTSIMYWLCSICYSGWAWFILLFPLILGLVLFVYLEGAVLGYMGEKEVKKMEDDNKDIYIHRTFRTYY